MIKTTTTQQKVIIQHIYCDVCDATINHGLACRNTACNYCGKDLCEKCIGHEEATGVDYRDVWCERCWNIGIDYRPKIEELNKEIETSYAEWRDKCKRKEK